MSSVSKPRNKNSTSKQKVKKPYNVKRSDLKLDEYIQQEDEKSPTLLIRRALIHLAHSRQLYAYTAIQLLTIWYGFGQIFFCIGILWSFYANTGTRKKGEMSAYSIFNEGVEAIEGSTDMAAVDRELRSRGLG